MNIRIFETSQETGIQAAILAASIIQKTLTTKGEVNLILATGASQFAMLDHLVQQPINWANINVFHLDEYIGLPETHPASFRAYLTDRFISRINSQVNFIPVNGSASDPAEECRRLARLILSKQIDLACVGIGENGHLAFNDPPADFETEDPYIIVNLDEACRKQQLGEGWFSSIDEVPDQAISMSIRQILKSSQIICTVPDLRKASAVKKSVDEPITNMTPASILQSHPACTLFLDSQAASLLNK